MQKHDKTAYTPKQLTTNKNATSADYSKAAADEPSADVSGLMMDLDDRFDRNDDGLISAYESLLRFGEDDSLTLSTIGELKASDTAIMRYILEVIAYFPTPSFLMFIILPNWLFCLDVIICKLILPLLTHCHRQRLEGQSDVDFLLAEWDEISRKLSQGYQYSLRYLPAVYTVPQPDDTGYYSNSDVVRLQQAAKDYGLEWQSAIKLARIEWRKQEVCNWQILQLGLV